MEQRIEISEEEMGAIQKSMTEGAAKPNEDTGNTGTPAAVTETTENSSLTNTTADAEKEAAENAAREAAEKAAQTPPPVKSLEELLAERTAGKFNKWEDVEAIINTPKEEFADENIKHWNELAKKGIKLDKEFFDLQSLDVDNLKDPETIVLEAMRRKPENKGLSDTTLKVEMNRKYNVDEWIGKEDADLTEVDKANMEIMMRDAHNDLDWLKNFKKERTFIQQPTPEQLTQQAEQSRLAQNNWEKYVDAELAGKVTNLSVIVDEATKEAFDYKISEADRKDVANTMKLLMKDSNVMFNQFAEKDGQGNLQINHQKIFEMLVKNKTYNEAVKNAYNDGLAVGARNTIKNDVKNVNFRPADHATGAAAPQTEEEAIALAMKNSGKSFL